MEIKEWRKINFRIAERNRKYFGTQERALLNRFILVAVQSDLLAEVGALKGAKKPENFKTPQKAPASANKDRAGPRARTRTRAVAPIFHPHDFEFKITKI